MLSRKQQCLTSEDSSELQHTEVVDDVHTVVSSQTVDNVPSMAH